MNVVIRIAALAWALLPLIVSAQEAKDERFEQVAAAVADKMKELGVPGAALGVSYQERRMTRGFGVTSVVNPLPVTDDTLFPIASISKTFTATVMMQLVDQGKIDLDAPVRQYLPDFAVQDKDAARKATIRTLLTHVAGWDGDPPADTGEGDDALARFVAAQKNAEQVAPINTIYSYNNTSFAIAGRVIEVATGKTFEQAVKDMLLDPLSLKHSVYSASDVVNFRFAAGHGGSRTAPVPIPWVWPRYMRPAGGLVSSVNDVLRYGEFHLSDGAVAPNGIRLLSGAAMKTMQTPQTVKHGSEEEVAISWMIATEHGVRHLSHGGRAFGAWTWLTLVPTERLAIAVFGNSNSAERLTREVTQEALRVYANIPIQTPRRIALTQTAIAEYVGRYVSPSADLLITAIDNGLAMQYIPKRGFPKPAPTVGQPGPAVSYAFYDRDRLFVTDDGPQKGNLATFIRQPDGRIGWVRQGSYGRVMKKQN